MLEFTEKVKELIESKVKTSRIDTANAYAKYFRIDQHTVQISHWGTNIAFRHPNYIATAIQELTEITVIQKWVFGPGILIPGWVWEVRPPAWTHIQKFDDAQGTLLLERVAL